MPANPLTKLSEKQAAELTQRLTLGNVTDAQATALVKRLKSAEERVEKDEQRQRVIERCRQDISRAEHNLALAESTVEEARANLEAAEKQHGALDAREAAIREKLAEDKANAEEGKEILDHRKRNRLRDELTGIANDRRELEPLRVLNRRVKDAEGGVRYWTRKQGESAQYLERLRTED